MSDAGVRVVSSMYTVISVRARSVAPLADAPYRHLRRLEQRRAPDLMKIMKPSHRCSPLKPRSLTLSAVLWDSVETNQMREVARATPTDGELR